MKQCIHCGKDLPDDASFCPYCETVQGSTVRAETLEPRKHKVLPFLICLAVLATILFVRHFNSPKVIDAEGPELIYGDYRLILAFIPIESGEEIPQPQEHDGNSLPAMENAAIPSFLYAAGASDGRNRKDDFLEQLESAAIETVPRDNAEQMMCGEPEPNPVFPEVTLSSNIGYWPACGSNDICWTLHMKNGDTLKLRHTYTCLETESIIYYPEDIPMESIEDLQALVTHIEEEIPPQMPVFIFLPAVTYEGDLKIEKRTCRLIGAEGESGETIFNGTIRVSATMPEKQHFELIRFSGDGPGVEAHSRVMLSECTFSNMKTGLTVCEEAYIDPHRCLFENCETGLLYDCPHSSYNVIFELDRCEFRSNRIGIHLRAFDNVRSVACVGCTFAGNGTDILNETDVPVDTSTTTFE